MTHHQIIIHEMNFNLPDGRPLFNKLNFTFSQQKIGIVGDNGIGKTTLLKLIAGELIPSLGTIQTAGQIVYVKQIPTISAELTIANVLGYEEKLEALNRIENGSVDPKDFLLLNDDWMVKEQLQKALSMFNLDETVEPFSKLENLSGGELTKLFLTKAFVSTADFLLLDEPTNHLDVNVRQILYDAILQRKGGVIIVSHDRKLLNLMDGIVELSTQGLSEYGGNYDFYMKQKSVLTKAKQNQLNEAKSFLAKVKRSTQSTKEKHEQGQAKGKACLFF